MSDSATLAAQIVTRSRQITNTINELIAGQDDISDDILELQMRKGDGKAIDEALLKRLVEARKAAATEIGVLAMERTELLDDVPIIRLATGRIKVVTEKLDKDAELIKRTEEKLKRVTKAIENAEKVLGVLIRLAAIVV